MSDSVGTNDPGPALPSQPPEPPIAGGGADRPSYLRTLRNRPFFFLWLSQLISQSGDYIFEVALLWLVLEVTGSAFAVAIVVTGTVLPGVALGPFLGVYVDRWDRRRTLLLTNVLQGVVVAALSVIVLAGATSLIWLFLIVLMLGSGATVVRIATNAFVPSVVPVSDLPPSNGLLSASSSTNAIVGLSIGGVFVATLGVTLPIEYDAATFFAAALLLLLIPRASPPPAPAAPGFRRELAEGIAFIRQHRFMVELISIGVIVNFFGNGVGAILAPYSRFVLNGGPAVYGFLGAFFAGGTLVGAGAMGAVNTRKSAGRFLFLGGVLLGIALLFLGLITSIPLALTDMLVLGVVISVTNIPIGVVLQAKVPGRLLGRVGATFSALVSATGPGGPLFCGWLAQQWSVGAVFLLAGAVCVAVIGIGSLTMRSLRTVEY